MKMWEPKNYNKLFGKIKGISENQLSSHFILYTGYVNKLNEINGRLKSMSPEDASYTYSEYAELKRRFAVAYNGTLLHEYYFDNLTGDFTQPSAELLLAIELNFGSMDQWIENAASGLNCVHGWLLLCRSHKDGTLTNAIIEEHHYGVLVEQDIIIAIDGWEHAYMIDYGIKKDEYFKKILPALDWRIADSRWNIKRS